MIRRMLWVMTGGVLLTTVAAGVTGCEAVAYVSTAFEDRSVEPVYALPNRPTLVLVDDPAELLSQRNLDTELASRIGFNMTENDAVATVIPQQRLLRYKAEAGSDFDRMPTDRVGHDVGAAQVVYVFVRDLRMSDQPGILRPSASVGVKVIDVATGDRMFPTMDNAPNRPEVLGKMGWPVSTQLFYRGGDLADQELIATLQDKMVNNLARDVARLFHEWDQREPGFGFDN